MSHQSCDWWSLLILFAQSVSLSQVLIIHSVWNIEDKRRMNLIRCFMGALGALSVTVNLEREQSLLCPFMLYIQTPSVMCCFETLQTNRVTALWLTLTLAGGQPKHVWHWLCSTESNICHVLFLCWIRQNHETSNYLLCVNTSSPTDDIWGLLSNMKDSNFNIYHLHLQWKSIGQI